MESGTPASPLAPAPSSKTATHWLLEGLFIVVSVLLAFGVSEYGEYRRERALARQMLASIQSEVEHNRSVLEPYLQFHRAWRDALTKADSKSVTVSGLDFFFGERPAMPTEIRANVPFFRHAAWDTATSTGALRLIDYDLAAALSEIYSMQAYSGTPFAGLFGQSTFYDPSGGATTARLAQTAMQETAWSEEQLLALYDTHLPAIRAAAGR